MNNAVTLAFAAASVSGALALGFAWYERRSVAHLFFVTGMAVMAVESILGGLALMATLADEVVYWQNWRLFAMSFLPSIWLFFSLSYARGNYREFLKRWRFLLAAAFLVPVGLSVFFRETLITSVSKTPSGDLMFGLGLVGIFLNFLFLAGAVLTLMNLERTFRSSVGTMRWRIKYMIVGLGILFAATPRSGSHLAEPYSASTSGDVEQPACILVIDLV